MVYVKKGEAFVMMKKNKNKNKKPKIQAESVCMV